jgi:holo-[acyl-carrier protein] synthase
MIHGVGVDLVNIKRLTESAEKSGRRFLDRVFTEDELSYCLKRRNPYPSLAARFAAKEALIKALHTTAHISFKDIEVSVSADGKPHIKAGAKLGIILEEKGILRTHLSLSHEKDCAVACVVLEG